MVTDGQCCVTRYIGDIGRRVCYPLYQQNSRPAHFSVGQINKKLCIISMESKFDTTMDISNAKVYSKQQEVDPNENLTEPQIRVY